MSEETKLRFFRCDACGADSRTSGETCEICGAAAPDEGPATFKLTLKFAGAECPRCREAGDAGACTKCGHEIPEPDPTPATRARINALTPLAARAESLVTSFEEFPAPHIKATPSQLAAAIVDARVTDRGLKLIAFARSVDDLDLETPATIGSEIRPYLATALDEVERLRDFARLLAEFETAEQVKRLPLLVARLGWRAAVVIEKTFAMLITETPAAAASAAAELQTALDPPCETDEISDLLNTLPALDSPDDMNARVALVTGREGPYLDELGLPSPVLIFAAPPGENTSFAALAGGARRYMSHLLDAPDEVSDGQAMLVLPAIQLALLDRPFGHHRQAELVGELLRDAHAKDPVAVDGALSVYEDHAGLAFETAMRVRRQIRLLATGEATEIDVVESAVEMYRQLAESHFRAAMRCALAVRAALKGGDPPDESILLGEIEDRVNGWHDELGHSLGGVIERHLRNAEAHQDYRVDTTSLEIILQDGSRLTLDGVEKLAEDLAGTVAAIDAAVFCHTLNTGRIVSRGWLTAGESPRLVELVARTVAAGIGVMIESFTIEHGALRVTVPEDSSIGRHKARTVLAAARPLAPSVTLLETYKGSRLMAAFTSEGLDRWSVAPENVAPLLLVELLHESEARCGIDETESLLDAIATCLRFTINEPISTPPTRQEIAAIARRLDTICDIAARQGVRDSRELSERVRQIRRAWQSLKLASSSRHHARQFDRSITSLSVWADQHMGTLFNDAPHDAWLPADDQAAVPKPHDALRP